MDTKTLCIFLAPYPCFLMCCDVSLLYRYYINQKLTGHFTQIQLWGNDIHYKVNNAMHCSIELRFFKFPFFIYLPIDRAALWESRSHFR